MALTLRARSRIALACLLSAGLFWDKRAAAPLLPAHAVRSVAARWVVGDALAPPLSQTELDAVARRRSARRSAAALERGKRDTRDVLLDESVMAMPFAAPSDTEALLAVDTDENTAWRGALGASVWAYTLPFRRVVHPALLRAAYGDASDRGIPVVYRWEYQTPDQGVCSPSGSWLAVPNGAVDDREPNQFVYGPNQVHARRQALFLDVDACALRLVVTVAAGGAPVVRELHLLEGAASLTRDARVKITSDGPAGLFVPSSRQGAVDGNYRTLWAGAAGRERWALTVELPEARDIDRVAFTFGMNARSLPSPRGSGRTYAVSYLPLRYSVEVSPDDDPAHLRALDEAAPPVHDAETLPLRRRLIHLERPARAKLLRLVVTEATGPTGERAGAGAAPVVRDFSVYDANDRRPVVREPLFLSVDANPSALTRRLRWGELGEDEQFARDVYTRLRRAIVGFDSDTGFIPDVSKRHDAGAGRFLEAIEGDDELLARPLLEEMDPPPALLLSGSVDWDFGDHTDASAPRAPNAIPERLHAWNILAPATDADRGMGALAELEQKRLVPMVGLCGGAHILAMFEAARAPNGATTSAVVDRVLARNVNIPIRELALNRKLYERAWWSDDANGDVLRPTVAFEPQDRLWSLVSGGDVARTETRELPLSHLDMLRGSAFSSVLSRFHVSAFSEYCRPWVHDDGPEPAASDERDDRSHCVRIPQAFHSTDKDGFPVIGFQFHPEQRDLVRFGAGSPPDARGDAMNVFANAVEMILESYVRNYWPHA